MSYIPTSRQMSLYLRGKWHTAKPLDALNLTLLYLIKHTFFLIITRKVKTAVMKNWHCDIFSPSFDQIQRIPTWAEPDNAEQTDPKSYFKSHFKTRGLRFWQSATFVEFLNILTVSLTESIWFQNFIWGAMLCCWWDSNNKTTTKQSGTTFHFWWDPETKIVTYFYFNVIVLK